MNPSLLFLPTTLNSPRFEHYRVPGTTGGDYRPLCGVSCFGRYGHFCQLFQELAGKLLRALSLPTPPRGPVEDVDQTSSDREPSARNDAARTGVPPPLRLGQFN